MITDLSHHVDERSSTARRLDPLTVETALRGHRPFRVLPAPEAAEVLRILGRRGDRLNQVAELLDVDPAEIADQYATVRPR
ncbi:hypothetical protein [Saccharothrix deserti]|uniref:hypothetical protein n=1 Tax=Saccharothrix deserti TaxID=2593674 RepID=UPI00131B1F7F|nr:hypothetical protein [Saccharothrix deserti]